MRNVGRKIKEKMEMKEMTMSKKFSSTIAIILVALMAVAFVGCGKKVTEKIDWSKMELGSKLPEPPFEEGELINNDEEKLSVDFYGVSKEQFDAYKKACLDMNYKETSDSTSRYFKAYNEEGYKLSLENGINDNELEIDLEAPMKMSEILWPTGKAGRALPEPKSKLGKFVYENDDNFSVYIGNTSKSDYNNYVKACSEKGFNVDYSKYDNSYSAKNAEGFKLSLRFEEGINIMQIVVYPPDDKDDSSSSEVSDIEETTEKPTEKATEKPTEKTTEKKQESSKSENKSGLTPSFKKEMDEYEKFMNDYVDFMKSYDATDVNAITKYSQMLTDYAKWCEDIDDIDEDDLTDEDVAYMLEVTARVEKKLLEIN